MVEGIKLALEQAGGKAGDVQRQVHVAGRLDRAGPGTWTPEANSANARKVAQDDAAVAYLGEFNSGGSAVSIPLLNEVADRPGQPGEHRRWPDHGRARRRSRASRTSTTRRATRNYAAHRAQGHHSGRRAGDADEGRRLQDALHPQRQGGLRRRPRAQHRDLRRRSQGLTVVANEGIDPKAPNFRSQAAEMKSEGADCFVSSGITGETVRSSCSRTWRRPAGRQALRT